MLKSFVLLFCAMVFALTASAKTGDGRKRLDAPESQAIFGNLSSTMEVSENSARAFVRSRFNINPADLTLKSQVASPMGTHFTFGQQYKDVPVYGVDVKVHFNNSGTVIAASSNYVSHIDLTSVHPKISPAAAQALTRKQVSGLGGGQERSAKLYILAVNGQTELAWEVVRDGAGPTWRALINAHTGSSIRKPEDVNRYLKGSGRVFLSNAVVATHDTTLKDQKDSAAAVPANAYINVDLLNLTGNGYLDGTYASSRKTKKRAYNPNHSFLFDRSSDGFSETMTYYYVDYSQRYIQSLGFSNVNNRQQVYSVNSLMQDNSFYSPVNQEMSFGTGGVDDAEDAEVIFHEYGHAIQDNQVPDFGQGNECGAMGEGFGDYWAGSVGSQFSGGYSDACVAEWDSVSYSTTNPPCLRRLDTTKHYPEDIKNEVHADGEIWSGALWQIFQALGRVKADKLILQHHFLLAKDATFNQGADALLVSAVNLGYSAGDVTAVRNILTARGFAVTQ